MKKNILIGGKAGQGVAMTSALLGKIFVRGGFYVFNYRDYPSLIRGGHNFNVLSVSDSPTFSFEKSYDIIVALDQNTIEKHRSNLRDGGFILGNKNLRSKNLVSLDLDKALSELDLPLIFGNNILVGYLAHYFGIPYSLVSEVIKKEFGSKSHLVEKSIKFAYQIDLHKSEKIYRKRRAKYFFSGNEAIALGALAGGLDVYFAYPMTPATPVLHYLARLQREYNILTVQLENEIAVINAALGASFAGAKTMVGTSGGGFALMAEACSLQGMSEVPLVVYLAQRTGPSTGVPTYNTQGDLKFALNIGHGEFPRIVVAPGDAKEAFIKTQEAFYLSQKYRVLTIILGDKHLGESHFSFDDIERPLLKPKDFILRKPNKNYKSYEFTVTGVSPRAVPGLGPVVRATGYEHREDGITTENENEIIKMTEKRNRKEKFIEKETNKLNPCKIYGKGENLIVSWGSTKGAILDSLNYLKSFRFLQILYLRPFPVEKVVKELSKAKKVVLVENNSTGLLGDVIREQTGFAIKKRILKYDGRPFSPSEIIKKLR
ncbi:2-oxoacid:acceptor oxidoreductase subunit alpha [bacterium]|nr:2-oxoacid:acceptor oxidoreductase subunit alpha [bacterium]